MTENKFENEMILSNGLLLIIDTELYRFFYQLLGANLADFHNHIFERKQI